MSRRYTQFKRISYSWGHRDRKTHLATARGVAAAPQGHRILFGTATDWIRRLTEAPQRSQLAAELTRLRRSRPGSIRQRLHIRICRVE